MEFNKTVDLWCHCILCCTSFFGLFWHNATLEPIIYHCIILQLLGVRQILLDCEANLIFKETNHFAIIQCCFHDNALITFIRLQYDQILIQIRILQKSASCRSASSGAKGTQWKHQKRNLTQARLWKFLMSKALAKSWKNARGLVTFGPFVKILPLPSNLNPV